MKQRSTSLELKAAWPGWVESARWVSWQRRPEEQGLITEGLAFYLDSTGNPLNTKFMFMF